MKITGFFSVLFTVFLVGGCETDPDIYIPSKPIPVIYAIFDDHDTSHYISITKTFGAEKSPADFGFIHDSLYWDNLDVEVRLKEYFTDRWIIIEPERVTGIEKDSGFFLYPDHEYFRFNRVILDTPSHPLYIKTYSIDSISVRVSILGYEDAYCLIKRIDSIRIVAPKFDQTYLYLVPSTPLLIIWDTQVAQHAWSEIDIGFEFIEERPDGYQSKWVHIQNILNYESAFDKYRQMNITYEEFVREVLLQIEDDPGVLRRYLGIVKLEIIGGDEPMVEYMKYYNGHSDYNVQGYTNIQNALGFIGTSTRFTKDSMRFDYETRQTLINENRLRKLRISKWTEGLGDSGLGTQRLGAWDSGLRDF